MSRETQPIPAIAASAANLLQQQLQQAANALAEETLTAMGLKANDGWQVDFPAKIAWRDVPDLEPKS